MCSELEAWLTASARLLRSSQVAQACALAALSSLLGWCLQDAGKSAASNVLEGQAVGPVLQIQDGKFADYRWKEGRWDLRMFQNRQTSQMDWDAWNSVRALFADLCA